MTALTPATDLPDHTFGENTLAKDETDGSAPSIALEREAPKEESKNELPNIADLSAEPENQTFTTPERTPGPVAAAAAPLEPPPRDSQEGSQEVPKEAPQEAPEVKGQRRQPPKSGKQWKWEWDKEAQDYIHIENGIKYPYTAYQRSGGNLTILAPPLKPSTSPSQRPATPEKKIENVAPVQLAEEDWVPIELSDISRRNSTVPEGNAQLPNQSQRPVIVSSTMAAPRAPALPPPMPAPPPAPALTQPLPGPFKRAFEEPMDARFKIVDKPKRFFTVGRIFKTVWFEPGGSELAGRRPDFEWTKECAPFHGSKPLAKFRWFVVVRKRLNHSLCFSITTFGGKGASKTRRGRAVDFVVLHSAEIEPPEPEPEEQITRDPIAVIIEEEEQYISPLARLDCGRIYTVEDTLKVMKIGRVHTDSLKRLNDYFKESVE